MSGERRRNVEPECTVSPPALETAIYDCGLPARSRLRIDLKAAIFRIA